MNHLSDECTLTAPNPNTQHSSKTTLNIDDDQFKSFGSPCKFDGHTNTLVRVLQEFDPETQPLALLRDQLEQECGMLPNHSLWEKIAAFFTKIAQTARLLITSVPAVLGIGN